jgi:F420H(2)-dependent quinone reductase
MTGRKSGQPCPTPAGTGSNSATFWLIAEHGRRANYVRNIEANPRNRERDSPGLVAPGHGAYLSDDSPQERRRKIGLRFTALS